MATVKQKKVFKSVVKGSTISSAMVKAGYSIETSKRTNKVTKTKGWQELMDKYIPDEELTRVHKEGLAAIKFETTLIGKGESEIHAVPDFAVRHRYMESGYKIKGKLKDLDSPPQTTNQTLIIINPPSNGTPKD